MSVENDEFDDDDIFGARLLDEFKGLWNPSEEEDWDDIE